MEQWIEEIKNRYSCYKGLTNLASEHKDIFRLISHIEHLEAKCGTKDSYIEHLEARYRKMEEVIKRLHDHPALQVKCDLSPEHLIVDSDVFHELEGILEERDG